ncbi:MAG: hypothetical protein HZA08_01045 [Nitrospirae bacterium]|nr:hypothetical protein [Nitrospirota bacterium]
MKKLVLFFSTLIFFLSYMPLGCSSGSGNSDNSKPPSINVTGNWSGSWNSENGINGGTVSLSLSQNGSDISGTITMGGSPCFSVGNISGSVSGNNISSGAVFTGSLRVDFDGTAVGNDMNGSYAVIKGGACTGDSGTWMVSK